HLSHLHRREQHIFAFHITNGERLRHGTSRKDEGGERNGAKNAHDLFLRALSTAFRLSLATATTDEASRGPISFQPMRRFTGSRAMRKSMIWPIIVKTAILAYSLSAGSPVAASQSALKCLCAGSNTPS